MSEQQYEEYGRQLAAHIPQSQFLYINELDDPDELIRGARTLNHVPLVVWEAPLEGLSRRRDSYTSRRQGSVGVLFSTDSSTSERRQAFAQARPLLLALLEQMAIDEAEGPLLQLEIVLEEEEIPLLRVGPFNSGWWGMVAEFSFRAPLDTTF